MSAPVQDIVLPSRDDPFVRDSAEAVGGVAGRRVRSGAGFWGPLQVLLVMATGGYLLGYLFRMPCHGPDGFDGTEQYSRMCYSDIAYLFQGRGFVHGFLPYLQSDPTGEPLEYPVLTGAFMQLTSWLTGSGGSDSLRGLRFYDITAVLLLVCLLVTVACAALTHRGRPWDAALVALAPAGILTYLINWDLLAVALTAAFLLAWARSRPVVAGLLLGLAVSAKFYPVVILGPLLLVCWRTSRWRAFGLTTGAAALSWLVVNVPVMLAGFDGWKRFYVFSSTRGEDWGSLWYFLRVTGHGVDPDALNTDALVAMLVCCAVIAVLAWRAPVAPRLAQLAFLAVAAFCLTNKVYSPQYVLWLIPLAALARPRWRDFLIWQAGQVIYFISIWMYLEGYGQPDHKALSEKWYAAAIAVQLLSTLYLCVIVGRDVLLPEHDPLIAERLADDPSLVHPEDAVEGGGREPYVARHAVAHGGQLDAGGDP